MSVLRAEGLRAEAGGAVLVDGADLTLDSGEFVALLGPNGAGKTSLIRAVLGLTKPVSGRTTIDGTDLARLRTQERARRIAYLPQLRSLAWPMQVADVVALGRFAHGAVPGRLGEQDRAAVGQALAACNLDALATRRTDTLSGGELARVHCARAFAAQTPLIIADEPIAALDPRHQFQIMDMIADFVASGGGALVILHDVQLAAHYASRLVWMKAGRIVADGAPEDTLTAARLAETYGIDAVVNGRDVRIRGLV